MSILFERRGRTAILTINRPEKLNSVDSATRDELERAYRDFEADSDLWIMIVTGAGDRAFSAGGDLKEWAAKEAAEPGGPAVGAIGADSAKITIAAINGIAIGGGLERALRCDFRVAADHARLRFSEVHIGLIPPLGVLRLPRLIAPTWAAEAMVTGRWIDAAEAFRIGLVHRVAPGPALMDAALAYADSINEAGPLAVRTVKQILEATADMPMPAAAAYSNELYSGLRRTEDALEGPRAFAEKRKPVFRAR